MKRCGLNTWPLPRRARATPLAAEALAANRQLVQGQLVRLERDRTNTDESGALLRYVYVGEVQVNQELVRRGLARVALVPPDTRYGAELQATEQDARLNQRGVWRTVE